MIIVKLQGGLGNQMFQYALGRYLAQKHGTQLKMDVTELLDCSPKKPSWFVYRDYELNIFNVQEAFASPEETKAFTQRTGIYYLDKVLNKVVGRKKSFFYEGPQHFHDSVFNAPDNAYLDGYWQSPKYFQPVDDLIRKEFTVKEPLTPLAQTLLAEIQGNHAVCVNIRRGDFVVNPSHNTCSPDYYRAAETLLLAKRNNVHFYVFSDEVDWCRQNLSFSVPTTFVSHQYAGKKFQDYLRLMSACNDFIIPNSSFAWWAAYLSESKTKTVIAPKKWMNKPDFSVDDLLPPGWIRI